MEKFGFCLDYFEYVFIFICSIYIIAESIKRTKNKKEKNEQFYSDNDEIANFAHEMFESYDQKPTNIIFALTIIFLLVISILINH